MPLRGYIQVTILVFSERRKCWFPYFLTQRFLFDKLASYVECEIYCSNFIVIFNF